LYFAWYNILVQNKRTNENVRFDDKRFKGKKGRVRNFLFGSRIAFKTRVINALRGIQNLMPRLIRLESQGILGLNFVLKVSFIKLIETLCFS
jgi:hypothetical protein